MKLSESVYAPMCYVQEISTIKSNGMDVTTGIVVHPTDKLVNLILMHTPNLHNAIKHEVNEWVYYNTFERKMQTAIETGNSDDMFIALAQFLREFIPNPTWLIEVHQAYTDMHFKLRGYMICNGAIHEHVMVSPPFRSFGHVESMYYVVATIVQDMLRRFGPILPGIDEKKFYNALHED